MVTSFGSKCNQRKGQEKNIGFIISKKKKEKSPKKESVMNKLSIDVKADSRTKDSVNVNIDYQNLHGW